MSTQWPEKKDLSTHKLFPTRNDMTNQGMDYGWNACHDAFMKAINAKQGLDYDILTHTGDEAQKVKNMSWNKEEVKKVLMLATNFRTGINDEQAMEYLSELLCSKFNCVEAQKELVPLNEKELRESMLPLFMRIGSRIATRNDLNVAVNIIISKFGTPKPRPVVTLDENKIYEAIVRSGYCKNDYDETINIARLISIKFAQKPSRVVNVKNIVKVILKEWTKYERLNVQMNSEEEATQLAQAIVKLLDHGNE